MKQRKAGPGGELARAMSKLGHCSRARAVALILEERVCVNGVVRADPKWPTDLVRDRIEVDGKRIVGAEKIYLMLNKPRGLVTTASDEKGRHTVFDCFAGEDLPFIAPVGRLDQASEGLLLFSNDSAWAARITAPESHLDKIYHVQIDCVADQALVRRVQKGGLDEGEPLSAKQVRILRTGEKNSWLEIVLDEGRNRQIRRLLSLCGIEVLRLLRVAIGPLALGSLGKGKFRRLDAEEVSALAKLRAGPSEARDRGRTQQTRPAASQARAQVLTARSNATVLKIQCRARRRPSPH